MRRLLERRDAEAEARFRVAYEAAKVRSKALEGPSLAERLAALPAANRAEILSGLSNLEKTRLLYHWPLWARPKQLAPEEPHRFWAQLSGRGGGKSRAGAERLRARIYGGARTIAIVGPTLREIKRYMIGGHAGKKGNGSGLLDVFPPHEREQIVYNKTEGEIVFHTGAVAYVVSAEDGEYRGGNIDTAWLDEVCKWEAGRRQALWDNIEFSLRSDCGLPVEVIITSTPNAHPFIRNLIADPDCITYLGSSDENRSNLEEDYIARLERKFGRSRKGRQERFGEVLTDIEGALFSQGLINSTRRRPPRLVRIVVSVDPAISRNNRSDRTAIVAIGIDEEGRLYLLAHVEDKFKPEEWASAALDMYEILGAHAIVGERNRGGDLVRSNVLLVARERARERGLSAPVIPYVETQATKSKESRAEELSTIHEQGRLHFPEDPLTELEDQITTWDPRVRGPSPNGLDAAVWGAFELTGGFGDPSPPPREGAELVDGLREANAGACLPGADDYDRLG